METEAAHHSLDTEYVGLGKSSSPHTAAASPYLDASGEAAKSQGMGPICQEVYSGALPMISGALGLCAMARKWLGCPFCGHLRLRSHQICGRWTLLPSRKLSMMRRAVC